MGNYIEICHSLTTCHSLMHKTLSSDINAHNGVCNSTEVLDKWKVTLHKLSSLNTCRRKIDFHYVHCFYNVLTLLWSNKIRVFRARQWAWIKRTRHICKEWVQILASYSIWCTHSLQICSTRHNMIIMGSIRPITLCRQRLKVFKIIIHPYETEHTRQKVKKKKLTNWVLY